MARKIQNVTQLQQMKDDILNEPLDVLVPYYGEKMAEQKEIKSLCDDANKRIKSIMRDSEHEFKANGWIATFSIQDRSTMNEERLIEYIKQNVDVKDIEALGIIKTKEYIDETALENAIYNNSLNEDVVAGMDKCKEPKNVEVLTVKRSKEKK